MIFQILAYGAHQRTNPARAHGCALLRYKISFGDRTVPYFEGTKRVVVPVRRNNEGYCYHYEVNRDNILLEK